MKKIKLVETSSFSSPNSFFILLKTIFCHFIYNVFKQKHIVTIHYPYITRLIYFFSRSRHRILRTNKVLAKEENLVDRYCPSGAIKMMNTNDKDISSIDMLKCIFCGTCSDVYTDNRLRMDSGIYKLLAKTDKKTLISEVLANSHAQAIFTKIFCGYTIVLHNEWGTETYLA